VKRSEKVPLSVSEDGRDYNSIPDGIIVIWRGLLKEISVGWALGDGAAMERLICGIAS
jgi:hypothetical protein